MNRLRLVSVALLIVSFLLTDVGCKKSRETRTKEEKSVVLVSVTTRENQPASGLTVTSNKDNQQQETGSDGSCSFGFDRSVTSVVITVHPNEDWEIVGDTEQTVVITDDTATVSFTAARIVTEDPIGILLPELVEYDPFSSGFVEDEGSFADENGNRVAVTVTGLGGESLDKKSVPHFGHAGGVPHKAADNPAIVVFFEEEDPGEIEITVDFSGNNRYLEGIAFLNGGYLTDCKFASIEGASKLRAKIPTYLSSTQYKGKTIYHFVFAPRFASK